MKVKGSEKSHGDTDEPNRPHFCKHGKAGVSAAPQHPDHHDAVVQDQAHEDAVNDQKVKGILGTLRRKLKQPDDRLCDDHEDHYRNKIKE